jgi:3-dehydroquinate synthase
MVARRNCGNRVSGAADPAEGHIPVSAGFRRRVTLPSAGSMPIKHILVQSSAGRYSVVCGAGVLGHAAKEIAKLGRFSSLHIVSSAKVWRAIGKSVQRGVGLRKANAVHFMNDAEAAKNLRTVELLARELVRGGADRKSLLIAVGGGIVGDVAGFVAASYLRGVALVHVPTTVVAQVDSSIGGKTGVNLPEGKNLVGAFYPPRVVLSDPQVLRTLPEREFRGGLAEIIKHAAIADPKMFAYLEKNIAKVQQRDRAALAYLIPRNVAIKAQIVTRDEQESGLREVLNFGHTFAHALEAVTHYKRYQHGEAVAWGMMAAALLGREIGVTRTDDVCRIVTLVRRMGPLPTWPCVPGGTLIAAMRSDKKTRDGKLRFVLAPRIGQAASYDDVPLAAVERVLRFAPHFFCDSGKANG